MLLKLVPVGNKVYNFLNFQFSPGFFPVSLVVSTDISELQPQHSPIIKKNCYRLTSISSFITYLSGLALFNFYVMVRNPSIFNTALHQGKMPVIHLQNQNFATFE